MSKTAVKQLFATACMMLILSFCAGARTKTVTKAAVKTAVVDSAEDNEPDTVKTGVYITSIHNIDFRQKEYTIDLWVWFLYKTKKFDFMQNLEIPMAKSVSRSFLSVDSSGERLYVLMKLQCVMKDEWKIDNFPFDHQNLRFSIENSQFDSSSLVFVKETKGQNFDKRFTLRKWHIDTVIASTGSRTYETGFGDPKVLRQRTVYSNYKVKMQITRNAFGLFWKMFLGMYLAFLIAFMCFFIHPDGIDSRFGLSVGALFAVVGNKYIVDSALPESTSFTLVDSLHGLTLFFILLITIANAYVLRLTKKDKVLVAKRFDVIGSLVVFIFYTLINVYLIYLAKNGIK